MSQKSRKAFGPGGYHKHMYHKRSLLIVKNRRKWRRCFLKYLNNLLRLIFNLKKSLNNRLSYRP